ncbi:MAG: hypothetical protein AAB463_01090 [Patescibacteria group bacterium]
MATEEVEKRSVSFFICTGGRCSTSWAHGHYAIPLGLKERPIWSSPLFSRVSANEYCREHFPKEDWERLMAEVRSTELPLILEEDIGDPDEDE